MRVALVIPWFGRDLKGGAEQQAWQVATRLAARGVEVTVLTTCSKDFFSDWSVDHYGPGEYADAGLNIIRFPVRARDARAFDKVNQKLLAADRKGFVAGVSPLTSRDEDIFVNENINSPELVGYLEECREDYDAFIFMPYLYGPILNGVWKVRERAVLQPCLHDEAYAYLDRVALAFHAARRILYNSEGEYRLAKRLYGPAMVPKSAVVGEGVEIDLAGLEGYAAGPEVEGDYLLCLGKKDPTKNTDLLVHAFEDYAVRSGSGMKLVFAGPGALPVKPRTSQVVDLGLVPEERKFNLLKHCKALVNPSTNESFSRVVFEAWFAKRPVVVHRDCLATYMALEASGFAGWHAGDRAGFGEVFGKIESADEAELRGLGEKGSAYARSVADWDAVVERYVSELDGLIEANCGGKPAALPHSIHQMLPNLTYGDAISNYALFLKGFIQGHGYGSKIFVRYIDPPVAHECEVFQPDKLAKGDGLIYHHSIGSELTPYAAAHKGKKLLIYHNITPASFFEPYSKEQAQKVADGRRDLGGLASKFAMSAGVSEYNAEELRDSGFRNPSVLRIPVEPGRWGSLPDRRTLMKLGDGMKNVVFVGRLAPNKRHDRLVEMFSHLHRARPDTRLCIVGGGEDSHPYVQLVRRLIEERGLKDSVVVSGRVDDAELHAYYKSASLYVSMSEHEGVGIPLIEAMWFDVPVLAYGGSAVPETLGDSGCMFTDKDAPEDVAALAGRILSDDGFRDAILRKQEANRERFLFKNLAGQYHKAVNRLGGEMKNAGVKAVSRSVFCQDDRKFRILVIKLDHMGDLLLAVPAIARLRDKFNNPEMDIVVGGWNVQLARSLGLFREIFVYNYFSTKSFVAPQAKKQEEKELLKKLGEYDIAVDLRRQENTRFLLSKVRAKLKAGYRSFSGYDRDLDVCLDASMDQPHLATPLNRRNITLQMLDLVDAIPVETVSIPALTAAAPVAGRIALFPGAGSVVKQWPAENFAELAARLLEHDPGFRVTVYLSEAEKELDGRFTRSDRLEVHVGMGFAEMADSLAQNSVSVTNNSFGAHISSYLGVPVVTVYSSHELVDEWHPPFGESVIIYSDVSCSPCHIGDPSHCEADLFCLKQISPGTVFDEVVKLLGKGGGGRRGVLTYARKQ